MRTVGRPSIGPTPHASTSSRSNGARRTPVYHAAAEEGIPFKEIAASIGRELSLPVESRPREHFGWFANFAAMDMATSSEQTRKLFDWTPTGPALLADLAQPDYYKTKG